jgi:hypothetical protein
LKSFSWTRQKVCDKRQGLQKKKIIFHQDNAPTHKIVLAMEKLRDLHYKLLKHSPDLAASDICLFTRHKQFLVGQHFS